MNGVNIHAEQGKLMFVNVFLVWAEAKDRGWYGQAPLISHQHASAR